MSGVVNMHAAVLNAVSETESSVLPREKDVMKLDMFPPGQAATRIIPRAIIGEIQLSIEMTRRNVRAGRKMTWQRIPTIMDLGLRAMSRNDAGLMPRATPNITNARTMLIMSMPVLFMWTSIASMDAMISGFMAKVFWNMHIIGALLIFWHMQGL